MSSSRSSSRLRKLARLEPWERLVLVRAAALLSVAVLLLRLLGFAKTRRLFAKGIVRGVAGAPSATQDRPEVEALALAESLARLVDVAVRHGFVSASCLPRSLVLNRLLAKEGVASELRIGARWAEDGTFLAHAWLDLERHPDDRFETLNPGSGSPGSGSGL